MFPALLLTVYCILVTAGSLAGGYLPTLWRLSHTTMQALMSGVGGFMLGVAVLHLFPHGVGHQGSLDWGAMWMLIGIVSMFFLIRVFHVHQHAVMEPEQTAEEHEHDHGLHVHSPACGHHHHGHDHAHDHEHGGEHRFSWLGLAFGLSLHTLIDGLALGAAVATGPAESVAIFLAVLLHKPLDALSITTTMASGGWTAKQRLLANIGFSLMCPLGAALFFFGVAQFSQWQNLVIGTALAFSAGVFLCVALADILPELSFHSHDRFTLSAALLMGVAAAYAIGFLEPGHVHGDGGGRQVESPESSPRSVPHSGHAH